MFSRWFKPVRVFISYRRDDSHWAVTHLLEDLEGVLGDEAVFRDIGDIPAGVNWRRHLEEQLATCSHVLVVIGEKWLTITDGQGRRRLDDENDTLRREIETALSLEGCRVIPVLVGRTKMPSREALPESLAPLSDRQGHRIRGEPDYENDLADLFRTLGLKPPGSATRGQQTVRIGAALVALGGTALAIHLGVRDQALSLYVFATILFSVFCIWLYGAVRALPFRRVRGAAIAFVATSIATLVAATSWVSGVALPCLRQYTVTGTVTSTTGIIADAWVHANAMSGPETRDTTNHLGGFRIEIKDPYASYNCRGEISLRVGAYGFQEDEEHTVPLSRRHVTTTVELPEDTAHAGGDP